MPSREGKGAGVMAQRSEGNRSSELSQGTDQEGGGARPK